jgi:Methyltransferase domain
MAGDERGAWRRLADAVARTRRRWRGIEPRTRVEIRCERVEHGGWWICPQAIRRGDVVYSFGVGGDLSFEMALVERYGARVFAFDPDPATAERAASLETPHPHLRLLPMSIGGRDVRRDVDLPGGRSVEARVLRLPSHMRLLGHRRIDVIRLDVPGAETDVIRDLVRMDVDVQQLLLAFREEPSPDARRRTESAVKALGEHGYRIFHISPDGRELSFIRTEVPAR